MESRATYHSARPGQKRSRRQKEKWRLLVNQVEEYAIFMLDRDGFVTTWNEGAKNMKGYAEKDRRLRTTNMVERFIQEVRRREKPIRIFPSVESARRLVGALCAETHEEWSTGRCYLDMEEFFEWRASHLEEESSEEDFPDDQVLSTENPADRDEAVAV